MLDPDVVLTAVVQALRSIPDLVTEMGGAQNVADNIYGHFFASGEENSVEKAVGQMTLPSILVSYDSLLGGNFNGESVWKHRLTVYFRSANRAPGSFEGTQPPSTLPHLWWLMMNRPVLNGSAPNIRYIELCNNTLSLMETPTMQLRTDAGGSDYGVGMCVFPEKGDDA